ncbi:hypothetical protein Q3C01_09590 [Bradyrhizobium sp. UFLA05-109]
MGADWYFLWAVLGPPLGFLLVIGAIPFLIYSLFASNAPRSLTASRITLILALSSALVSGPLWVTLISGQLRDGSAVDYHDRDFVVFEAIATSEALVLLASVLNVARRRARRIS